MGSGDGVGEGVGVGAVGVGEGEGVGVGMWVGKDGTTTSIGFISGKRSVSLASKI